MRILVVIVLSLVCVDISAQNAGAGGVQGFQSLPSNESKAEPLIRYHKIQTVWNEINLDPIPVSQWKPSVPDGTDTSSTMDPGFYFDPYSAYTTTDAQVAGKAPPGWTLRHLYMTARPCKLYLRHFCSDPRPSNRWSISWSGTRAATRQGQRNLRRAQTARATFAAFLLCPRRSIVSRDLLHHTLPRSPRQPGRTPTAPTIGSI